MNCVVILSLTIESFPTATLNRYWQIQSIKDAFDDVPLQLHSAAHGRREIDRYLHSETCQLSGICKSWRLSHLAASFIDYRAETFIAECSMNVRNNVSSQPHSRNSSISPHNPLEKGSHHSKSKEFREWSCCRFTYSNLVTTFASSRLRVLPNFDSVKSCPST